MDKNMQTQQGSGSAENMNRSREEQRSSTDVSRDEKKEVAKETGLGKKDITDIRSTGNASGRDDYAGGSGEGMESQDTGAPTDR